MKYNIIEIVELGKPQSIIQRDDNLITELIKTNDLVEELNEQLRIGGVSQRSELFYNFITWYNAITKVNKPKNGLITTSIIDKYLKL